MDKSSISKTILAGSSLRFHYSHSMMHDKDRQRHQEHIAGNFSKLSSYWRDIYSSPIEGDLFYHHEAMKKRKQAVLDFVDLYAAGRKLKILDAGCGPGMIMESLIQRGHIVYAIDVTEDMVKETAAMISKYPNCNATVKSGSIEDIDFNDHSFDLCICIGVLQYLKDDALALQELSRVVSPGGHVIISIPNMARVTTLFDPYYYVSRLPLYIMHKVIKPKDTHDSLDSKDISRNLTFNNRRYLWGQLDPLFEVNKLDVCGTRSINYGPLTFWQKEYLPRSISLSMSRKLEQLVIRKGCSLLQRIADRWVIALQKKY